VIRLRKENGELVELPDKTRFVELCTPDGTVIEAIWIQNDARLMRATAGSTQLERYCRVMRVVPAAVVEKQA
jgi:hypothetical protein